MKNRKNRKLILLLAIVAAMAVAVGGTIAYLVDQTSPLVNTFTPTEVGVDIEDKVEEVENGVKKSNVVIENTGTTSAYIRARIVGNWVETDANNNKVIVDKWDPAADGEFVGLLDPNGDWVQSGDYYYYTKPVEPGGTLEDENENALFESYTVNPNPEFPNAHLEMDILVQAIQSEGGAVDAAWGTNTPVSSNTGKE